MFHRRTILAAAAMLAGLHAGCRPPIQTPPMKNAQAHTNRLASEKSPYLLQHQHNPVDWHPWGAEAFDRARRENKPIFLSIGYSTCHWCHVMERESFENEAIAALLNAHFVSIKVDREERPDVDKIYMTAVQAMSGQGGWPLSVFLTPDLKPFYGGTYFPPETRHGRMGFPDLLNRIQEVWRSQPREVQQSAEQFYGQLASRVGAPPPAPGEPDPELIRQAAALIQRDYDPRHGGFGGAPKFPTPSLGRFLLRSAARFDDAEGRRMVLHTCDRMAAGGIHDQIGGGFARYSVDAEWLVPHFEKMLYDNAQLAQLYLDAWLAGGEPRHAGVVRGILDYVLRDMTHPEGGFYSAEDADSEGKEGKFYCWTRAELASLLTPEEFRVAARHYGITERGNFVDHSDPDPLPHLNVLSVVQPDLSPEDRRLLEQARSRMFDARTRRVRPHLDDKVLASWNGLMLGAMARGGVLLESARYLEAAEKNARFLRSRLWDASTRTLYHRWRDGERDQTELLEDYAFLLEGVLALYEAGLDPEWLEFSVQLAESMLDRFYDREQGGFWQSPPSAAHLILKIKEDYDGAEPSGNSVACLALLKLAAITGRENFRQPAMNTLRLFSDRMHRLPQAVPYLLMAADFSLQEPRRVVIAGEAAAAKALLLAAHQAFQPNRILMGTRGPVEPFAASLQPRDGRPTAYVCTGSSCRPPTHDPETVREHLLAPE